MVVNVVFSSAIWKILALKCSRRIKSPAKEERGGGEGRKEISGFVEYLATLAPDRGPIPWLHLYPRECFPCQHTFLPVAEHSVSCGFGSRNPGPGRAWFCFYQWWAKCPQFCGGAAAYLSRGRRFLGELNQTLSASAHHKCTVIDMVVPTYTNSLVS